MATYSSEEGESFEVEEVVDMRKRGSTIQYLIKWKGYDSDDNTWESTRNLQNSKGAIEAFKKKQKDKKTPSTKKSKQIENKVEKTAEKKVKKSSSTKGDRNITRTEERSTTEKGGRSITKTTFTKVETRTISGGQSEVSSPESSPVLTRRSVFTSRVANQQTTSQPLRSSTKKPGVMSRICRCSFPVIVLSTCVLFAILAFIVKQPKK